MYRYNLQIFAESAGEKTEDATPKKLEDARKKGQVAKSTDLTAAATLITLFLALRFFLSYLGEGLMAVYPAMYNNISKSVNDVFSINEACTLVGYVLVRIIIIALPLLIAGYVVTVLTQLMQVKWKVSLEPLKPKLERFDPVSGMKRLFSKDKLMELAKSIAKIAVITLVVYNELKDQWGLINNLYSLSFYAAISLIGSVVINVGFKISIYFFVIAIVDFAYQKLKFKKDMKMTKQEVKDEYKQSEGDPQIKGQIRQRMRQASQRRMMQELPKADVVITNPTHLAVAILYDREKYQAPVVIAKGADFLAQKIKDAANENNIEIVENKPLARMLYHNVDIGAQIPPELYQMVAEILAYVYGLKGKLGQYRTEE